MILGTLFSILGTPKRVHKTLQKTLIILFLKTYNALTALLRYNTLDFLKVIHYSL